MSDGLIVCTPCLADDGLLGKVHSNAFLKCSGILFHNQLSSLGSSQNKSGDSKLNYWGNIHHGLGTDKDVDMSVGEMSDDNEMKTDKKDTSDCWQAGKGYPVETEMSDLRVVTDMADLLAVTDIADCCLVMNMA